MNCVFKFALLWLLTLAIPIQAYAAAAMFDCGATHHQKTLRLMSDAAPDATAHVQVHAGNHHHAAAHAANPDLDSHDTTSTKHGKSSCSACAACCVGVAVIPSGLSWTSPYGTSQSPVAAPAVSFSGHIPTRLERPPRFILV